MSLYQSAGICIVLPSNETLNVEILSSSLLSSISTEMSFSAITFMDRHGYKTSADADSVVGVNAITHKKRCLIFDKNIVAAVREDSVGVTDAE